MLNIYVIYATEVYQASDNDLVVTNELLVENGCLKGKVIGSVTQSGSKDAFDELVRHIRVRPKRCVVVVDDSNDTGITCNLVLSVIILSYFHMDILHLTFIKQEFLQYVSMLPPRILLLHV